MECTNLFCGDNVLSIHSNILFKHAANRKLLNEINVFHFATKKDASY